MVPVWNDGYAIVQRRRAAMHVGPQVKCTINLILIKTEMA